MKKLTFVTGNHSKFKDIQRYLSQLDPTIELLMEDIDIPEIQSLDVEKIAKEKAQYAWKLLKRPILIDDGGIFLERFNKFPGALSKYVTEGIGLEGVWLLAKDDPRAFFKCWLVYQAEECKPHIFTGTCHGTLIEPTGPVSNPYFPYTQIFVPKGATKTYAELREKGEVDQFSHRKQSVAALVEFFESSGNLLMSC